LNSNTRGPAETRPIELEHVVVEPKHNGIELERTRAPEEEAPESPTFVALSQRHRLRSTGS